MHEFLLFAQVPASRHHQVLSILAGVAGSQPVDVQEQVVLLHPLKLQQTTTSSKKIKQQQKKSQPQAFAHSLIRSLALPSADNVTPAPWRLYVPETPEPGVKNVVSRAVTETQLSDVNRFKEPSNFNLKCQYLIGGHRLVHRNVIIRVYRIMMPPMNEESPLNQSTPPPIHEAKVLDQSGDFLIDAVVRVEDRTNSTTSEKAISELLEFKEQVKGAIGFRIVERLSLDTRVKIA